MNCIKNMVYGSQDPESQVLDLYLPEEECSDLLIYFHGGGLEAGDKEVPTVIRLTEYGKAVISANYRMYPKAVYPQFIEDAAAVVQWAREHIGSYKPVKNIFVSGSSAGAYLTAMLAFAPDYLGQYGIKTTDITGYIIDSAQTTTHFNVLRERGLDTKRIVVDEAAPVYHIHENTVFPNIMVLVSDNDMPCRLEQNLMFLKTLEMFGCPAEKVTYRLMGGFRHCEYVRTDGYPGLLNDYIEKIKSEEKHYD